MRCCSTEKLNKNGEERNRNVESIDGYTGKKNFLPRRRIFSDQNFRISQLRVRNKIQMGVKFFSKCSISFGAWLCMVMKFGRFGQQIRNTSKVLKCGAGERWRRSVGPIM